MPTWKFFIETHGCKVNQNESQLLREAWKQLGGVETDHPELADYILINSCAITSSAERDSRNAVYRFKRKCPQAKTILTGCAAQLFSNFEPRKNDYWAKPDLLITQRDKALLLDGPQKKNHITKKASMSVPVASFARSRPIIKIQDGCSAFCSYCIVPYTRGKPASRPARSILAECRSLLESGFCELVISGINLSLYHDPGLGDFWELLKWLDNNLQAEFHPAARIRISSLWPAQLSQKGIHALTDMKMACPHIHISLQHASPAILRAMGREHCHPDDIARSILELRRSWPRLGLGADIITGFPGETENDIAILKDFIQTIGLNYAHIFPFSIRPGTQAASMKPQIPKQVKRDRARQLRLLVEKQQNKFLLAQTELSYFNVALDQSGGKFCKGVNEFYASCQFIKPVSQKTGLVRAKALSIANNMLLTEEAPTMTLT